MVYPNPNRGEFTINATQDLNLILSAEDGRAIRYLEFSAANNHQLLINDLPDGIYFLATSRKENANKIKIIVSR